MDKKHQTDRTDSIINKIKGIEIMKSVQLKLLATAQPNWEINPELTVIDTILEQYPKIIETARTDYDSIFKESGLGRQDIPSLEQIIRAALYKKHRDITYAQLEYENFDSKLCSRFLRLDILKHFFSASTWQKYISAIKKNTVEAIMVKVNQAACEIGIADLNAIRIDSTVVETNIHYPTNNSLVWNCIEKSHSICEKFKTMNMKLFSQNTKVRNLKKQAKKNYFKLNNVRKNNKNYKNLFKSQLVILVKSIKQLERLSNMSEIKIVELNGEKKREIKIEQEKSKEFIDMANIVYRNTVRHEIENKKVSVKDKLFSIYEPHTDIIVKGNRQPIFGHKVNLVTGKSSLILYCNIEDGNPSDTNLYKEPIDKTIERYGVVPKSVSTDGGYASLKNRYYAQQKKIQNIVFNKSVGSLQNIASSKRKETILKKWRSGIEAVISNLKRGFSLRRVNWKGKNRFDANVLWSVLAYNFRVITNRLIELKT